MPRPHILERMDQETTGFNISLHGGTPECQGWYVEMSYKRQKGSPKIVMMLFQSDSEFMARRFMDNVTCELIEFAAMVMRNHLNA